MTISLLLATRTAYTNLAVVTTLLSEDAFSPEQVRAVGYLDGAASHVRMMKREARSPLHLDNAVHDFSLACSLIRRHDFGLDPLDASEVDEALATAKHSMARLIDTFKEATN